MNKPFTAEQFTPIEKFYTAQEKADVANKLASFILRGFPEKGFTNALYEALRLHFFDHIAEYNKQGFYHSWFSTTQQRLHWVRNALACRPMGLPQHTWVDVERAMQRWIRKERLLEKYQALYEAEVEQAERAELARLRAKYGEK